MKTSNALNNIKFTALGLLFNIYPAIFVGIILIAGTALITLLNFSGVFDKKGKPDYSYVNLQKCEVTQKYDNRDNEFVVRCKFD